MPKFIKIFIFAVFLLVCGVYINRAIPRSDANWEYKTYRPLFAGWSTVREPVVDADRIYFCGGYGWWSNQVIVVALDFKGQELWRFDIGKPCDSLYKKDDKIIATTSESKTTADKRIEKIYRRFVIDPATGTANEESLAEEKPEVIINTQEGIHRLIETEGRVCFIESAQRAENGILKCFGQDQRPLVDLQLLGSDQFYVGKNLLYSFDSKRYLRVTDFESGTTRPLPNSPFNVHVLGENLPVIYLGAVHKFYAYDLQAEKVLWETKLSGWVRHVKVLQDQLLITDDDGILTSMPLSGPIRK